MKKITFLSAVLFLSLTSFAQNWALDKAHAKLGFSIVHLMISDVEGGFKSFDVKVTSSKADFSDAEIEPTANASSVSTDNEMRDNHIKGADFFDVAKHPTLTFKSKSLKKVAGKNYKLYGDLTMHGITKAVVLDVVFNGVNTLPNNKKVAGFKIGGTIKRSDFAIGSASTAMLSDEITLIANLELNEIKETN